MDNIIVLMSTYNGDKYLQQQVDSILNQKGVDIKLYVRIDGGNSQNTLSILNKIAANDHRIIISAESNIGCAKSFWKMLNDCPNADFYAFSDQDDVWYEDKLESAINILRSRNNAIPQLYCSNVDIVNENLQPIGGEVGGCAYATYFPMTFIKSLAPGCTFVFNDATRKKCIEYNDMLGIHDWTMTRIVSLFGEIYYDYKSHMAYRQHGNNVIGASTLRKRLGKSVFRLLKNSSTRIIVAEKILLTYSNQISDDKREKLMKLINYNKSFKTKLKLIKDNDFLPKSFWERVGFRLVILLGKI